MEWFENWFDTEYYHILYNHRDFEEAEKFMLNLLNFLKVEGQNSILDIPCGKGRHSLFLNQKGHKVTGVDLSENSIKSAKEFENIDLKFFVHDIRKVWDKKYDLVFNLFTSFGYFETEHEDRQAFFTLSNSLKYGGYLVIDYINTKKAIDNLKPKDLIVKENIEFLIQKEVNNGFIEKYIDFEDKGEKHSYKERVKALLEADFDDFAKGEGLEKVATFGDYDLKPFDKDNSPRLILIFRK